ncbi:hypothetical protein [Actinomadura roseirufa]|uniref:hypothetical protein n=1 Tax=Actinomadura roseirufa TaxID=2094049 RepID=UPI001040F8A2|nr:hypothetical protein [Actinomadura roseirufa]
MSGDARSGGAKDGDANEGVTIGAHDQARVGGMFGVLNGDVHIYDVAEGATGEQRFTTALNLLAGHMPRRAEELIVRAVEQGYFSNKVAYYWALAVLSDRTFDHLDQDEFSALRQLSEIVDPEIQDEWLSGLNVITRLINCLIRQQQLGSIEDEELDATIHDYQSLPKERREEFDRHLDQLKAGAIQDRLDTKNIDEVRRLRLDGDRGDRAYKFFLPTPRKPVARTLEEPPDSVTSMRVAQVGGGVAAAAQLTVVFTVMVAHPMLALLCAVGVAGGGYLLATSGRAYLVARGRAAAADRRHGRPRPASRLTIESSSRPEPGEPEDRFLWGDDYEADRKHRAELTRKEKFRKSVRPFVKLCFDLETFAGSNHRRRWEEDTEELRSRLETDILQRYAGSDAYVGELDWLITWRVKQARELWEKGEPIDLYPSPAEPSDSLSLVAAFALGTGIVCGLAGMLWGGFVLPALILLVLTAAGLAAGYDYAVRVVRLEVYRAEAALAEHDHQEELAAHQRALDDLKDTPTDAEMARWLDYDKIHIKNRAMKAAKLVNRDIVAHAVLTEAKAPCLRARVLFGPPRYSRYRVIVFLLTVTGLRMITFDLDFLDGTLGSEIRRQHRYDQISSASMHLASIEFDSGRRVVTLADGSETAEERGRDPLVLGRAIVISLVGGEKFQIVVENLDEGFLDRVREDKEKLFELAIDHSGISGVLYYLDAISVEGREWIDQERNRRARRQLDFKQKLDRQRELSWTERPGSPLELET